MDTRIPVYEHSFGDGLSILKTRDNRFIAEPSIPSTCQLLGHIIAPAQSRAWETGNGIDVTETDRGLVPMRPHGERVVFSTVPRKSFDLALAMYYAEHAMHGLRWDAMICEVAAPDRGQQVAS